jgi:YfiH family protein
MNQVHSDKVKVVKSIADALVVEEVDAQVTREKNIALAVMTADCLPVLLRSIDGDVVAAVHCGWKGLASNVLENTILAMNCERNKIMAWLGPCIGEKCFEVGKEVKQIFEDKNLALGQFFKQTDEVHYLADLKGIAKFILNQLNVYNVSVNEECTYSNVDKYYSYRKEKITGRMAGVIWI